MSGNDSKPASFDTLDALLRAILAHERTRRDSRLSLPTKSNSSSAPLPATPAAPANDSYPA
jgi:hypothetical protein